MAINIWITLAIGKPTRALQNHCFFISFVGAILFCDECAHAYFQVVFSHTQSAIDAGTSDGVVAPGNRVVCWRATAAAAL